MSDVINGELPSKDELDDITNLIRCDEMQYLVSFADILNRYIASLFRGASTSRLMTGALNLIILRGGSLSPSKLSRFMLRSKHAMTKIVDNLENEGFVIRERNKRDRRALQIRITKKGLKHVEETILRSRSYTENVLSTLSKKERAIHLEQIKRLRQALIKSM